MLLYVIATVFSFSVEDRLNVPTLKHRDETFRPTTAYANATLLFEDASVNSHVSALVHCALITTLRPELLHWKYLSKNIPISTARARQVQSWTCRRFGANIFLTKSLMLHSSLAERSRLVNNTFEKMTHKRNYNSFRLRKKHNTRSSGGIKSISSARRRDLARLSVRRVTIVRVRVHLVYTQVKSVPRFPVPLKAPGISELSCIVCFIIKPGLNAGDW